MLTGAQQCPVGFFCLALLPACRGRETPIPIRSRLWGGNPFRQYAGGALIRRTVEFSETLLNKLHPPKIAIFLLLVVIGAAVYYGLLSLTPASTGPLRASGTIETIGVKISPELVGKVAKVLVAEGQSVHAGDPLLVLDNTLLTEQRKVAAAALETAKAANATANSAVQIAQFQYQQTLDAALTQAGRSRIQDWFSADTNQFDQPNWYFSRTEQLAAVQAQVDLTKQSWDTAEKDLSTLTASLSKSDFALAEKRLLDARAAYLIIKPVYDKAQNSAASDPPLGFYNKRNCVLARIKPGAKIESQPNCIGDANLEQEGQALYDAAVTELTQAQQAYNDLLSSKEAQQILSARAKVEVMRERYYQAYDSWISLQTGEQAPAVLTARSALGQAQAVAAQSVKAVEQAQAGLDLVDVQIAKLTILAPLDGVVLTRNVEPGEFIQPGSAALELGDLSRLTITVYVPEGRYGEVLLGQNATVTVDSFPDVVFGASVEYISDRAEFTPRNVQTVEGRSSTVYGIKLKVTDPEGKLKPGMPADVVFVAK